LRVNKPKYRRYQEIRNEWNGSHRTMQHKQEWRQKDHRQTYAQVVGKENNAKTQRIVEQSGAHIMVEEDNGKWLEKCFIGRVVEVEKLQLVMERFLLEGFNFIRVRYLGGQYMLLSRESDGGL